MEQLKVIGTEGHRLILATESGDRYSLAVDDVLRSELRRARPAEPVSEHRASPRDIQARIRAGLSSQEVAELLGTTIEVVERYEGPVLAEREYIVGQALAIPVLLSTDFDDDADATFGSAVRGKLAEADATGERWTSWKESTGWVVKLEFAVGEIDHDARWTFEPRSGTLTPLNSDATQLSRQGSIPDGLIPRLRALDGVQKDESRFDSAAFGPRRMPDPEADIVSPEPAPHSSAAAEDAAINRSTEAPAASAETTDLLEALRRRRGQREPAPGSAEAHDSSPVALFDALEPGYDEDAAADPEPEPEAEVTVLAAEGNSRRRGRSSLPSWDEIVFGARTDD